MSDTLAPATRPFEKMVDEVARQLITTEHLPGGSYINTPMLYPSGSTVVVQVQDGERSYFVSDMGLGYREADMIGAGLSYGRHARTIAENAGVGFDNQDFFVLEVSREQLPGAVMAVANCSLEAVALSAYKLSERRTAEAAERLYDRLVGLYTADHVQRHAEIIGASSIKYHVATLVHRSPTGRQVIFDTVNNHYTSAALASSKFNDISRVDEAPVRVAVVRKKQDFNYLGLISQSARVIDAEVPSTSIERIVNIAA